MADGNKYLSRDSIIIIIKTIFHQGAQLTNSDFQRGPELDKVLSK